MTGDTHYDARIPEDSHGEDFQVTRQGRDPIGIEIAYKTDIGRVRTRNEDCLLTLDLSNSPLSACCFVQLLAVADGLGGHAAGGTASCMAIDCLRDAFTGPLASRLSSREEALAFLKQSFIEANSCVHTAGAPPGKLRGMGTTLVAALVGPGVVDICNVGDSRAYVFDGRNGLRQVTKDHSWEAEYAQHFQNGTAELAGATNLLTRALGPQRTVEVDDFSETIDHGDILFLCSDGLSRMIPHEEIRDTLAGAASMGAAAEELVRKANDYGGEDNITVVLARPSVGAK